MTFQNIDEMLDFFDQIAEDRWRESVTAMLLDADKLDDPIGDVIDGAREFQDDAMAKWRRKMRAELESWPVRFPLTLRWVSPTA